MEKKKNNKWQKKNMSIIDDVDQLSSSIYTEISADGLKFIKDDIKVGREGLSRISGDKYDYFQ